jgi:hypothetical protein
VQAPDVVDRRLVPEEAHGRAIGSGTEGEIRLTYRELTALIEDAVRHLRS